MPSPYIPAWLRGTPLEQVYVAEWINTGDPQLAREAVRNDSRYDSFFGGNRRDDGTVRYDEDTYLAMIEGFEDQLLSVNLNPDLFSTKFADLIAGNVSVPEFGARIANVYDRVIDATPEVAAKMDEFYQTGFTTQAIVASFMDPDLGEMILDKRISMAEIGAEASTRGFNIVKDFANQLYEAGVNQRSQAAQFFGLAENALPVLQGLAARHDDPDDDFSLQEFASAQIFNDPAQRRRLRLLVNQEQSLFGEAPETAITRAQSGVRAGGLTGLAAG